MDFIWCERQTDALILDWQFLLLQAAEKMRRFDNIFRLRVFIIDEYRAGPGHFGVALRDDDVVVIAAFRRGNMWRAFFLPGMRYLQCVRL